MAPRTAPHDSPRTAARPGRRRHLAVVLTMLAAAAGPAAGAEARFTTGEAVDATRVAWGYWHSLRPKRFDHRGFRCAPRAVRIVWRQDLGDAMATAELWDCLRRTPSIRLERPTIRRLTDVGACGIVTHEFGHLLGYRHVRKATQLMSGHASRGGDRPPKRATWQRAWSRCRRRL